MISLHNKNMLSDKIGKLLNYLVIHLEIFVCISFYEKKSECHTVNYRKGRLNLSKKEASKLLKFI